MKPRTGHDGPTVSPGGASALGDSGIFSAVLRDIELAEPIAPIGPGAGPRPSWLLIRLFDEPLGILSPPVPAAGLTAAELARMIDATLGEVVRARVLAAGGPPGPLTAQGARIPGEAPFRARRDTVLAAAPPITVALCTRERPLALTRCLRSLLASSYPDFRILVVDNAPTSPVTREAVAAAGLAEPRGRIEYLVEPEPGLSWARNRALAECGGEIVAWIDDDETADPHWLAEIACAFAEHPGLDAMSGLVVPAELKTRPQLWFEQFGGHSKGRGTTPALFGPSGRGEQSPLYPLPPFGTGANMAFRGGVLSSLGGFDTALGAGSPASGAEDTQIFTRILRAGGSVAYAPAAVTRHYHRPDLAALERQMYGYGCGLTAYYTSLIWSDPRVVVELARLVPDALRDLRGGRGSQRAAGLRADFPRGLLALNLRGMLVGPLAYARGRRRSRQVVGRHAVG